MNRKHSRIENLVLALVFAAGLMAAGCGGSGGGGGDDGGGNICNGKMVCDGNGNCTLTGTFCKDLTLTSDANGDGVNEQRFLLSGGVFIGNDRAETVITIQEGTTIYGLNGTPPGMLVIRRGSKIRAVGTAAKPIVFTSANNVGNRSPGDWGGLILNGRAPVNICGAAPCDGKETPHGEGASGPYGGDDPADSSGILKYVRVEYAGHVFTSDDELNGIAFQGVGSGTTIEYIQVHRNKDDGIEMFGGNVNMKYALVTGCVDDSFDWTFGWNGMAQFVVLQQYTDASDNGIEADNNEQIMNATPSSHPLLANFTVIGQPSSANSDIGVLLRHGTEAEIYSSIVLGFEEAGLDIDSQVTWDKAYTAGPTLTGDLTITKSIVWDANGGATKEFKGADEAAVVQPRTVEQWFLNDNAGNQVVDPLIVNPFNQLTPDYRPQAGSPALVAATLPVDPFFTAVNYLGAMDDTTDWTAGWTTHDQN